MGNMTIHDNKPSFEEESRLKHGIEHEGSRAEGVYPHLHEERGPLPTSLSSSLPHHRSVVDDQPSDTEKNSSGYEEQRPAQGGSTHKEHRQLTPVRVRPLAHSSSSGLPNSSVLQPTGELSVSSSESPGKCWYKELDQEFQSALKQKLSRSDSTWISATSLV